MRLHITIALIFFSTLLASCVTGRKAQDRYGLVMSEDDARAKAKSDEAAARMEEEETGRSAKRNKQKKADKQQQSTATLIVETNDSQVTDEIVDPSIINYVVRGRVVGENGKPIEGIQVILLNHTINATPENLNLSDPTIHEYIDATSDTTGADGRFHVIVQDNETTYMRLFVRDIDGPSHGNYINEVINVYFDDATRKSHGHGWRHDSVEKRMVIKPKVRR